MDLKTLCIELAERYPQWRERINVLQLRENPEAAPVRNDGRTIFYSDRHLRLYRGLLPHR